MIQQSRLPRSIPQSNGDSLHTALTGALHKYSSAVESATDNLNKGINEIVDRELKAKIHEEVRNFIKNVSNETIPANINEGFGPAIRSAFGTNLEQLVRGASNEKIDVLIQGLTEELFKKMIGKARQDVENLVLAPVKAKIQETILTVGAHQDHLSHIEGALTYEVGGEDDVSELEKTARDKVVAILKDAITTTAQQLANGNKGAVSKADGGHGTHLERYTDRTYSSYGDVPNPSGSRGSWPY